MCVRDGTWADMAKRAVVLPSFVIAVDGILGCCHGLSSCFIAIRNRTTSAYLGQKSVLNLIENTIVRPKLVTCCKERTDLAKEG